MSAELNLVVDVLNTLSADEDFQRNLSHMGQAGTKAEHFIQVLLALEFLKRGRVLQGLEFLGIEYAYTARDVISTSKKGIKNYQKWCDLLFRKANESRTWLWVELKASSDPSRTLSDIYKKLVQELNLPEIDSLQTWAVICSNSDRRECELSGYDEPQQHVRLGISVLPVRSEGDIEAMRNQLEKFKRTEQWPEQCELVELHILTGTDSPSGGRKNDR